MFGFHSKLPENNRNDKDNKVRVTVIGEYSEGVLKLAVSRCSRKDRFVKKIGTARAVARLKRDKLYKVIDMQECKCVDFINIAKQIAEEVRINKVVIVAQVIKRPMLKVA